MGMYTELIVGCSLKRNIPIKIINVLRFLTDDSPYKSSEGLWIPDDKFFQTDRWSLLLTGCAYEFGGCYDNQTLFKYDDIIDRWFLSVRCAVKNYTGEIEFFLDWLKPFIHRGSGGMNMYAISIYEDEDHPTIYYLGDDFDEGEYEDKEKHLLHT